MTINTSRRQQRAQYWAALPHSAQVANGDELRYADLRGSFSKGLPHNDLGEVDPDAFNAMVFALNQRSQAAFNNIPLGSMPNANGDLRRLANPQNGLGIDLVGPNPAHLTIPPAPAFNGEEIAAEIAENYWMALCRDVAFRDYDTDATVAAAAADLSKYGAAYKGGKDAGGVVTPQTLFRGNTPGELKGPYISQFLLQNCYFGAAQIDQRMRSVKPGVDYMTSFNTWLEVQRGFAQPVDQFVDPDRVYIRNGRDLGQWVHIDVLYQAYFNAMLILLGSGARLDIDHPYRDQARITKEYAFGSFGGPHLQSLLPEVARRALRSVWYQKWAVHRRLRPEVFAARIHLQKSNTKDYGIHETIISNPVLDTIKAQHGSYLLPMAFPEGSPTHPAYGAGHATVAGACVTLLKAWFDTAQPLGELQDARTKAAFVAKVPSADGLGLNDYAGADKNDLTVGDELNKLAMNVGVGRNIAGVHWRSDHTESIKLGERAAIEVIADYIGCFNEDFAEFNLQKFDGSFVKITANGEEPQ